MTAQRVLTNGEITVVKITFGRFVNDNGNKGGGGRNVRRRGEKKKRGEGKERKEWARAERKGERERERELSQQAHRFICLNLMGFSANTKTLLRNASLNLPHKTLIVDWLLNAPESTREKIAAGPSTVWHETPVPSFLFFFSPPSPPLVPLPLFQARAMLFPFDTSNGPRREICGRLTRSATYSIYSPFSPPPPIVDSFQR